MGDQRAAQEVIRARVLAVRVRGRSGRVSVTRPSSLDPITRARIAVLIVASCLAGAAVALSALALLVRLI